MNTIKTILLSSLTLLSLYNANAQSMKEPVAFKLKNGMNVIVSENSQSAKAYSSFTIDRSAFDTKKDGVLELFIAVLNESVDEKNSIQFTARSGRLNTTNSNLDADLTEMSKSIKAPKIDESVFEAAKTSLLAKVKANKSDYDQSVNTQSVSALSLSDVTDFYNQITPENTYLTIAGNVELATAKDAAKKAFGNWVKTPSRESNTVVSK
ncbi:insulinase family protein [Pedobacter sp. AW1-32]|uniref:insulinase family protein n=1 Tax=Pedobacter sp. AW1-32 TaxID=3383026 RepID=UPI003FED3DBB